MEIPAVQLKIKRKMSCLESCLITLSPCSKLLLQTNIFADKVTEQLIRITELLSFV